MRRNNNIRIFETEEERNRVVTASERGAILTKSYVTLKKYDVVELESSDAYGFINFGDGEGNIEVNREEFFRFKRIFNK